MLRSLKLTLAIALFVLLAMPRFTQAQVHGPGPSDPALFDAVINVPSDFLNGNIGGVTGQTTQLNILEDGALNIFGFEVNSGAEVNVSGGGLHSRFEANAGSEVNVSGGNSDWRLAAFSGSLININGGEVGEIIALSGSELDFSGGITRSLSLRSGSLVNISGGFVAELSIRPGSEVNISGGTFGIFEAFQGTELFGGEFRLNGAAFTDSTITLSSGDLFSCTLADGSSHFFTDNDDLLSGVTLTPTELPPLDTTPIVVNTPLPDLPSGLRAGQTLTLQDGGQLGGIFEVVDATLNIEGGSLDVAGAARSQVNVSGGSMSNLNANFGSVVNISGGSVELFEAHSGSVVNISGGSSDTIRANSGSVVNIRGASVGNRLQAFSGSEVNLFGTQFFLDGTRLSSLVPGHPFTISDRGDILLTGTLLGGSAFSFDLRATGALGRDSFDEDATLTITLGEPIVVLGDVSGDGTFNFLDISPFIALLSTGGFQDEADMDRNGALNFLDIGPFISVLSGQ